MKFNNRGTLDLFQALKEKSFLYNTSIAMSFSALGKWRLRIGSSRPVLSYMGPGLKKLKREERAEAGEMIW